MRCAMAAGLGSLFRLPIALFSPLFKSEGNVASACPMILLPPLACPLQKSYSRRCRCHSSLPSWGDDNNDTSLLAGAHFGVKVSRPLLDFTLFVADCIPFVRDLRGAVADCHAPFFFLKIRVCLVLVYCRKRERESERATAEILRADFGSCLVI